jgi:hypothetical protein
MLPAGGTPTLAGQCAVKCRHRSRCRVGSAGGDGEAVKNTLIIQFPPGKVPSRERVIEIEDTLIQAFEQNRAAVVDGHDFGTAANIFISPDGAWDRCVEIVLAYLRLKKALGEVLVIKRLKNQSYQVIWPAGYAGEFERV